MKYEHQVEEVRLTQTLLSTAIKACRSILEESPKNAKSARGLKIVYREARQAINELLEALDEDSGS